MLYLGRSEPINNFQGDIPMSTEREKAIAHVANLKTVENALTPIPEIIEAYASDVFNADVMKKMLPKQVYTTLMNTIKDGAPLDAAIAEDVANAMKQWAISKGATHYTHWFQPLTGSTAEKHDSFLEPDSEGNLLLKFSGKNLIVGEPDASSFPSGGLRSTFEARGYTACDPTSPAFIRRGPNCATLCIPTAFCSYTGEALDKKTPLLRSLQALKKAVLRMMKAFGAEKEGAHVSVSLGAEQEYFLIDRSFYYSRPDLIQSGRTLFGAPPPKHQQLEDHYFGTIKPRILAFMSDVDRQLWKLGIPAKTRHNEVAPAQFEIAPLYEDLNLAVDHNMLLMEVLKQTAEKHGLVCLLHEKPFAGINGSGKHNNWSLSYGDTNLLNPGNDPHQNALFITTLCAIIKAVDVRADLLRVSTAAAGNDHRLGANEAPPAIISIFLGEQLTEIINQLEAGSTKSSRKNTLLTIGVDTLPNLPKDATDRNRTSPFAFTGNKFEFRAPGSSQSCAGVNVILNAIVAEAIDQIAAEIEKFDAKADFNTQLQSLLRKIIKAHKRVIFNGNGYDAAWVEEAHKRGLPDLRTTPEALERFKAPDNIALLEKMGVFSKAEVHSRYEIFMEEYARKVRIEAELSLLLARTVILPAAQKELKDLLDTTASAGKIKAGMKTLEKTANAIGEGIDEIDAKCMILEDLITRQESNLYVDAMHDLRKVVDGLEKIVSDAAWPLPKYREMLFIY